MPSNAANVVLGNLDHIVTVRQTNAIAVRHAGILTAGFNVVLNGQSDWK
jgi:hypothetical protein